jgi:hypothetical protein
MIAPLWVACAMLEISAAEDCSGVRRVNRHLDRQTRSHARWLGRCNDAPWYRYTFSDSDFVVEAPQPALSNFGPRHGV